MPSYDLLTQEAAFAAIRAGGKLLQQGRVQPEQTRLSVSESVVKKELERAGWTEIGCGKRRLVMQPPNEGIKGASDIVIKFSRGMDPASGQVTGCQENRAEFRLWSALSSSQYPTLSPGWVAYPHECLPAIGGVGKHYENNRLSRVAALVVERCPALPKAYPSVSPAQREAVVEMFLDKIENQWFRPITVTPADVGVQRVGDLPPIPSEKLLDRCVLLDYGQPNWPTWDGLHSHATAVEGGD